MSDTMPNAMSNTISGKDSEFLWVEKYRPITVNECILPVSIKDTFLSLIENKKEIPTMLFSGTQGIGKTSLAKAICNQIGVDYKVINSSMEMNIDLLRNEIKRFASTVSFHGTYKVVILDEADYLSASVVQPALRNFIEEFSSNCRFILTCNYKNRIIAPLQSRCSVYEFSVPPPERAQMAVEFYNRIVSILRNEGVAFEKKALMMLIERHFPDFRRVINECQRHAMGGKIDISDISNVADTNIEKLISALKRKDFISMRKWVADNDMETHVVFRSVYDQLAQIMKPDSIPAAILFMAEYQYKAAFVADVELNMVACFIEIMSDCEFV
jgi:DNA polymerase III delta prime subunit